MSLEIIGMIGAAPEKNVSSKSQVSVIGSGIDGDHVINFAKAHDDSGFDKVLVGYSSNSADGARLKPDRTKRWIRPSRKVMSQSAARGELG